MSDKMPEMLDNVKESQNLLQFLVEIEGLKHLDRKGWTLPVRDIPRPETVAGHMYRMAVMAMLYVPDDGLAVDNNKLVRMALIHDMAECIVGDITPFDGISSEKKHEMEMEAMGTLASLLPDKKSKEFKALFEEYESQQTIEAKIVKEFDLFDVMLQAFQYEQREYQRNKRVIKFQEFFDNASGRIKSQQLLNISKEIDKKRSEFWAQIELNSGINSQNN